MEPPSVLLNDFRRQWTDVRESVMGAVERVGESGWYILGPEVSAFEEELAAASEVAFAAGCASGLDAIELALRALGLKSGQKVLTTPLSAFATTLAILRAGGVPVFVDVDEGGSLDLDRVEAVLRSDRDIRFLVIVHLYGLPADLRRLAKLKADFDLRVVEDMAQAMLAKSHGLAVGSVGQLASVSFYPTKNLGALGDGGAVLGSDGDAIAKVKRARDYGQSRKYVHDQIGMNSRLDELHAAVLRTAFLPRLRAWTERRNTIAERYRREIQHEHVKHIHVGSESRPVWHLFPVLIGGEGRDHLATHLRASNIQTAVHYPTLIPLQAALQQERHIVTDALASAQHFAKSELSLPIHPYLEDSEIDRVIRSVNAWPG